MEETTLPIMSGRDIPRAYIRGWAPEVPYANARIPISTLIALSSSTFYPEATTHIPKGATGRTITVGGSGADGWFDVTWSGGNFISNPKARFRVQYGRVADFVIDAPGLYVGASPTAPTPVLTASSGLTGASVTLTVGDLVASGGAWWADHATDTALWQLYRNVSGTATALTDQTLPKELPLSGDASTAATELAAISPFGSVPTKNSDGAGDYTFTSRADLTKQPKVSIDLSVLTNVQNLYSSLPAPYPTISNSGATIRIQNNRANVALSALGTSVIARNGMTLAMTGKTITLGGTFSNVAFGILFTPTAPTLGGATAILDASSVFIGLRSNGTIVAQQRDGSTAASGVTLSSTGGSAFVWYAGQTIRPVITMTSATTANVSFYADGGLLGTVTVAGLPSGAYAAAACRWAGNTAELNECSEIAATAPSMGGKATYYLDPNNAGAAIGTDANPFTNWDQAVQEWSLDAERRELIIQLKAGVFRPRSGIKIDPSRYRRIRIEGVMGHGVIIQPSVAVTTGWTNIAGTEVWYRPNEWGNISGSLSGFGGLIETTSGVTQSFGRTGGYTITGRRLHTARSLGTAHGSLNRGDYSVHQASTYAGQILVRCYDGGDPNGKNWELSTASAVIEIVGVAHDAFNGCDVELINLDLRYGLNYGVFAKRVNLICDNVASRSVLKLYGFEADECNGRFYGCLAEGTGADGYHSTGGASSDVDRRLPLQEFFDCDAFGVWGVGDGWSNHAKHRYMLKGCRARSVGKDGISAIDEFRLIGFDAQDCADSGVKLAPSSGANVEASVQGGRLSGNLVGIQLNAAGSVTATLDAYDVKLVANVERNARVYGTGAGNTLVMNAYDCKTSGTTPSSGHYDATGGTLNRITGTAL